MTIERQLEKPLSPTRTEIDYRPHIDGLRAIAVLSIVFYHLNIFSLNGGFVGVDIFFVISGFLISKIILNDAERGRFSYAHFYARRARRILPAFTVVSIAVILAGYVILLPSETDRLAASYFASTLFLANIYFELTANYFAPDSVQLPLLHYWSLGVEEQFYLLFPPVILLARRFASKALPALVILILSASLMVTEVALRAHPIAAFYLLPYRASEFAVGTLGAVLSSGSVIRRATGIAFSIIGLALILLSLIWLDSSMAFPGIRAMPVCVGTVLLILGGETGENMVTATLSLPPLRMVGRYSFSLYLIHWPVYIYARREYHEIDRTTLGLCCLFLSIALAALSFHFIESPVRQARRFRDDRSALWLGAALLGINLVFGGLIHWNHGFPGRTNATISRYMTFVDYTNPAQFGGLCFANEGTKAIDFPLADCLPKPSAKTVVLWGDSGIAQYSQALGERFSDKGYSVGQIAMSACPPMVGMDVAVRPECLAFNRIAMSAIIAARPTLVVLGSLWPFDRPSYVHLAQTLDSLSQAGIRTVVLGQGPSYDFPVPILLADRIKSGNSSITSDNDLDQVVETNELNRFLQHLSERYVNVTFAPVFERICPGGICPMAVHGDPAYRDRFHTTADGADLAVGRFFDEIIPNG